MKEKKTCSDDQQNFVATRMSLPLFMLSREFLPIIFHYLNN